MTPKSRFKTTIYATVLLAMMIGCSEDNPVVQQDEIVTTPDAPSGPTEILPDSLATFVSGGAHSSFDHPVEYHFDFGDGRESKWSATPEVTTSWASEGGYKLGVQARCAHLLSTSSTRTNRTTTGMTPG